MKVDFFSFNKAPTELRNIWINEIHEVIKEGIFVGGRYLESFENEWNSFTKSNFAVGVSNGMDGLVLGLRSLNIGEGDFVAVPAHTFIATWNAVISVGATPVGVDVDEDGLMDLNQLSDLTSTIDAVIPVHMHGSPVDMKTLYQICNSPNLKAPIRIIEDASQAHGVLCPDGTPLGKYSDLVVYSMYPTKNLGALGDAGIVTTDRQEISERIRSLSNYGSAKKDKYLHKEIGFNNRLDPIQAAILSKNLNFLTDWNSIRKKLSSVYIERLSAKVRILQVSRTDSVRHHLCILVNKRDTLREFLFCRGIKTEIHYPYSAGEEVMNFLGNPSSFPNAKSIANSTLSLPLSQWHSEDEIDYVASQVLSWIDE